MTGEMTKVISVRIPMTAYMGFIKKATQNKLTVSEFLYTKLFSDEDIERDKNEIIDLKAALMESNEKMASVVNERDGLDKALIESNDKIASIVNTLKEANDKIENMEKALRVSDEKMISMTNEHNAFKKEKSECLEKNETLTRHINQEKKMIAGLTKANITLSNENLALKANDVLKRNLEEDIKKKPKREN